MYVGWWGFPFKEPKYFCVQGVLDFNTTVSVKFILLIGISIC